VATGSPTLFDTGGSTVVPVGSPSFLDTRGIQIDPVGSPTFYDTRGIAIDPVGSPTFYDLKGTRVGVGAFVRVKQFDVSNPFPSFITIVSELPDPVGLLGHYAYVSDAVGGGTLVFSDNSKWRKWEDRIEVI